MPLQLRSFHGITNQYRVHLDLTIIWLIDIEMTVCEWNTWYWLRIDIRARPKLIKAQCNSITYDTTLDIWR